MTSVQDSINALYAEAERNAKDGTPMFALLHGLPADGAPADLVLADRAPADRKPTADAQAEIPIPMQPDTAAMDTADSSPRQTMEAVATHTDSPVAYADQSRAERFEALRMLAEREVDAAPVQEDSVHPTVTHDPIERESLQETAPMTHAAGGVPAALPEQPPAPPALETDKDLDITDIHQLVQQAWEDGDAGMGSPVPENQNQKSQGDGARNHNDQSTLDQTGDTQPGRDTDESQNQAAADIDIAMENIAAAVKDQQSPAAVPLDVDALKGEIVQAVKSEFRQALRDDLAPVVRNVVTEVMAEISKERAARERAAKELAAKELAAKELAASNPAVKSAPANAGAKKAAKSTTAKTAGTVQAKAAVKKAAKSSAAKASTAKSSATKSSTAKAGATKASGTKSTAKAKTRAKKTPGDLDIG